jgi:hypothetical protein
MASTGSSNPFVAGNPAGLINENMPITAYVKEPGTGAEVAPRFNSMQCGGCIVAAALSRRERASDRWNPREYSAFGAIERRHRLCT